jgi:phosphatidylcholine synthase
VNARLRAGLVHVLTATGAAFALLALIDAAHGEWQGMFVWLGVALFVDTIDGPLARRARVTEVLPRWSGERLDLIVDYLTYVGVPAFAVAESDLLPAPFRVAAAIAILLSSLFHMADLGSKTGAGYFVGFPAIWNVVLLYLFAFSPPPVVSLLIVGFFVGLTFVPILAVHPFRVAELRLVTLPATVLWVVAAVGAVANPFPSPPWVKILLALSAATLTAVGFFRAWRDRGRA